MKYSRNITLCALVLAASIMMNGCSPLGSSDVNTWISSIETGSTQGQIESSKPENVTVHWDKPISTDSLTTEYNVTFEDADDLRSAPGPSPGFFLVFQGEKFVSYGGRN